MTQVLVEGNISSSQFDLLGANKSGDQYFSPADLMWVIDLRFARRTRSTLHYSKCFTSLHPAFFHHDLHPFFFLSLLSWWWRWCSSRFFDQTWVCNWDFGRQGAWGEGKRVRQPCNLWNALPATSASQTSHADNITHTPEWDIITHTHTHTVEGTLALAFSHTYTYVKSSHLRGLSNSIFCLPSWLQYVCVCVSVHAHSCHMRACWTFLAPRRSYLTQSSPLQRPAKETVPTMMHLVTAELLLRFSTIHWLMMRMKAI